MKAKILILFFSFFILITQNNVQTQNLKSLKPFASIIKFKSKKKSINNFNNNIEELIEEDNFEGYKKLLEGQIRVKYINILK